MTHLPRRPLPPRLRRSSGTVPALALAALAVGLGGCAAKGGTFGDEIDAAGARYAEIGDRWEDGQDRVAKGRKLRNRGRERIRDGEDDLERGERLIREGEAEMERSRRDYERLRAGSPSVGPAPGG